MIIAVNNNKGGSLKTTVTTNLAGVLALQEKKVLIVDADSQSNVALSFGVTPENLRTTLYDVLTSNLPVEDAIVKVHDYIDIIPAGSNLAEFEFEVIENPRIYPNRFDIMADKLGSLEDKYDYIFIDTPPSLGLIVGNAFTWAEKVLIPYTPEFYSMRSLVNVIEMIEEVKASTNPSLEVLGILYTLVNYGTNTHNEIIKQTNKYAYDKDIFVFGTSIPRTIQFADSVAYKQLPAALLPEKERNSRYNKANLYFKIWWEVENELGVVK